MKLACNSAYIQTKTLNSPSPGKPLLYPPSEWSELANILFYFLFRPSFSPSVRPSVRLCTHRSYGKIGEIWTQDLCMWGDRDNHYTTPRPGIEPVTSQSKVWRPTVVPPHHSLCNGVYTFLVLSVVEKQHTCLPVPTGVSRSSTRSDMLGSTISYKCKITYNSVTLLNV